MIKAAIFDWGDTIMRDFPEKEGPACYWDHLIWIPGAEDALKNFSAHVDCFVASNSGLSDTSLMVKALKRMKAAKYFDGYFTSADLGFEKPDIRFFNAIIRNIGCLPYEAVMIGNNYNNDIEAAKNAGMITVFFNEFNLHGQFEKADLIISQMDKLFLERIIHL